MDTLFGFPWAKLYKKEIIDKNNLRFPIDMKMSEDSCFNISYVSCCKKIRFVENPGYLYRRIITYNKYSMNIMTARKHLMILNQKFLLFKDKCQCDIPNIKNFLIRCIINQYRGYVISSSSFAKYKQACQGGKDLLKEKSFVFTFTGNNFLKQLLLRIHVGGSYISYLITKLTTIKL